MLYIAAFIIGTLAGYACGKIDEFIDGMDGQYGGCTQDCNQVRNCTCGEKSA
jgi:hypothetical protein